MQVLPCIDTPKWNRNVIACLRPLQLFDSVQENYGVQVPTSFEEWETRYNNSNNTQEWIDTGIFHPWVNKNDLFITQNAYKIINLLTFDDKGLFTRKLIKCLIFPLKLLMKLRIKYGFYY